MLNLCFKPFPVLTTPRLILRSVTAADVNEIFFLRSDKGLLTYLDKDPEPSVNSTLQFIQRIKVDEANADGILWGITLKESSVVIGTICFWRMQKEHYRAEIGYVLHADHQGKGIMQESLQAVLGYGFNIMHLHSVEANVNPGNTASIRLLEKNNFVKEAHFKENYYHNGKFTDSIIYSLLTPHR